MPLGQNTVHGQIEQPCRYSCRFAQQSGKVFVSATKVHSISLNLLNCCQFLSFGLVKALCLY